MHRLTRTDETGEDGDPTEDASIVGLESRWFDESLDDGKDNLSWWVGR